MTGLRIRTTMALCLMGVALPLSTMVNPAAAAGSFSCNQTSATMGGGFHVLRAVTTKANSGFDSVIFQFATVVAPTPSNAGTVTVAKATPPLLADPSGKTLAVDGSAFVKITFQGTYGHDPVNSPPQVPAYAGPTDLHPGLSVLTEVRQSGDFEGVMSWIAGLSSRGCWRVTTFTGPVRVQVDFRRAVPTLPVTGVNNRLGPLGALGWALLLGGVLAVRASPRAVGTAA